MNRRCVGAVVGAVLLPTLLVAGVAPAVAVDSKAAATVPTAPRPFKPAKIVWKPCPEDATLECSVLQLPVDYRQPQGQSFGLGVIRAKATDASKRIGVLLTNPGGPAVSGVDALLGGVAARAPILSRLRERFDVIAFDPRGAKRSRPVRCDVDFGPMPPGAEMAALTRFLDDVGQRYVRACAEHSGEFVFSLSANNTARDMDMLREALGERRISYVGLSFGTQLGAVYGSMFPQRLRAMVLDAGIAPETEGMALLDFWAEHTAGFGFAFHRLDQWCRANPDCPLREAGVVTVFDELSAQLAAAPAVTGATEVSQRVLHRLVGGALYRESRWPDIVRALKAAHEGDFALLLRLSGGRDSVVATTPTLCGTYATRLPAARVLPFDAAFSATHPRFFGRSTPFLDADRWGVAFAVALCSAWPAAEETRILNLRDRLAHAPLLIGNDFDNATPIAWTRRLATALGFPQSVLRYEGGGHGVATSGNPCTDDAIVSYLIDLKLPPPGATCPGRLSSRQALFSPQDLKAQSRSGPLRD
jgi:pimeloyl-ACP methyl ester carboxylesterase